MKKVYIVLSVDILHHGHINLINEAKKHGKLIVSLPQIRLYHQKKVTIIKF